MARFRTTKGLAAVARLATRAAAANPSGAAGNAIKAPTAASNFRLVRGVLHAQGCPMFPKVYVYACFLVCGYFF